MKTNLNLTELTASSLLELPRKTAFWAGLFYLLTFVSVPTLFLYQPIHRSDYLMISTQDHEVVLGGILEIIVALCGIATAVILHSVFKKQNQVLALGLMASRIVEAGTMFVGVAFLLGAVSIRQQNLAEHSVVLAQTLVTLYDKMFVLGQGFMPGVNDLLLGILLLQTRLVPRWLSIIGISGAFALWAGYLAIMFGLVERVSPLAGLSALLVAFFEFTLGIYLLIKGVKNETL